MGDFQLFKTHEQLAKAIEPGMRDFHHPSPGTIVRIDATLPLFLAARADVGHVALRPGRLTADGIVIALIGAQVLGRRLAGLRTRHDHRLQRLGQQRQIGRVRPSADDANRHPASFRQQAALGPRLAPIGRIGAGFFPRPAGLWSSPHQCFATSTPSPPAGRTAPGLWPRAVRTLQRPPIGGSNSRPCSTGQIAHGAGHSTAYPCAAHRRCQPQRGANPLRSAVPSTSCGWAAMAPAPPRSPLVTPKRRTISARCSTLSTSCLQSPPFDSMVDIMPNIPNRLLATMTDPIYAYLHLMKRYNADDAR